MLLVAWLAPGFGVTAELIADPTRPPAALLPTAPRAAAPGAGASAPPPRPAAPLPVLQAVLRPANGQATAMIDGRVIQVGEPVGDWTLHAIHPDAVLLRNGTRQLRLALLTGLNNATPPLLPTAATARTAAAPEARPSAPPSVDPLPLALPKEEP